MIKNSFIVFFTLLAFCIGVCIPYPVIQQGKYNAFTFAVDKLPTQEKRGDTQIKFANEFLELYYHKNHGAWFCYFDLKSEAWKDGVTGYEI